MKPNSLDQWRNFFQSANSSIFEIIDNAIRVAALDHPNDWKVHRPHIVEKLYSCQLNGCCCKHNHKELAVPQETKAAKNKNGRAKCGVNGNADVLQVGHERAAKVDNQRDKNGEISMTEKSKYSYKEAEALIDEIDEHNESIHEVLRIKGVLLNHQEESETALFDSLRRLQLMNLSVVVLQATEIGNAVNALQKHWSKRITQLANILISGWDKVLEEWIDAAAAIKESAKNDALAVFGEMGLPTPPMDEAAFLASQVPMELSELKFFDGIDEDGNVQILHKDNMTQESKRSPQGKHQNATNVNVEHLKEIKLLDDDVMQRKFETTKRKQGEDYQAADNARRKQAKLMDLHDLPKGGSGPSYRKPKQKNQKPERAHV